MSFQNALAASADRVGDNVPDGSKAHAGSGAGNRGSGKQEKEEPKVLAPYVDSQTTTQLPAPDLKTTPVQNVSGGEGNSNPPSTGTSTQEFPISAPETSRDLPRGMLTAAPNSLAAPNQVAGPNSIAEQAAVAPPSVGIEPSVEAVSNAGAGPNAAAGPTQLGAQNSVVAPTSVAGSVALTEKTCEIAALPVALPATSDSVAADGLVQQDATDKPDASAQSGTSLSAQPVELVPLQSMSLQIPPQISQNFAGSGVSNLPVSKGIQKDLSQAVHPKNSDTGSASDAGKSKATDASDGAANTASKNAQDNSQTGQHGQSDPSAVAVAVQKADDGGAPQQQSVASHVASHVADAGPRAVDGGANTSARNERGADAASGQVDGEAPVTPSSIHVANLAQTMSGSEMRVGMHSSEFGNISIRTTVSQQQMFTEISLDHSDLSQAISAHVATVQTKLGNELGLHALVEVNNQTALSYGEQGSSSSRDQRYSAQTAAAALTAGPTELDVGLSPEVIAGTSNGYRLDIRA